MDSVGKIFHERLRVCADDGVRDRHIDVFNPYTGEVVGTVARASQADVKEAFRIAAEYKPQLTRNDRATILRRAIDLIDQRVDQISDLITAECGICKKDSLYETRRSKSVFDLAASLAIIDDGQVFSCDVTPGGPSRKIFTTRSPLAAISAITPFNHPLNQVAHKIAPSIATNNCMVLKPTEKTPLTALLLADILYDAGLPREMFQVITGDPAEIADEFITNEHAELVTFTGGVAIVTAKDKLRGLLGHGLDFSSGRAICFSSEKADQTTLAGNGIDNAQAFVGKPIPSVYSAELSEFIFDAGVKLMERDRPDLMYLSTTDYIQHKHAPGTSVANAFYTMMDGYLSKLDALGATLALTADHGMNAKHTEAGEPDVIYLQDFVDDLLGSGEARVILPITDPYVVHHGALGSFATIYLRDKDRVENLLQALRSKEGILYALDRQDGCREFELPEDRLGDVIVVSDLHKVLGTSVDRHDLTALEEPLRSHGGITEQRVPLLFNRPVRAAIGHGRLRNFDIYDVALNHIE